MKSPRVTHDANHTRFHIDGLRVARVTIGPAIVVEILNGSVAWEVTIASDYVVTTASGESTHVDLSAPGLDHSALLGAIGHEVTGMVADEEGRLVIAFGNPLTVEIEPSRTHESWSVLNSEGLAVLCMSDGDISISTVDEEFCQWVGGV